METPRSSELAFDSGGDRLVGTLWLPPGAGPHPALVMLQGSGDSDRDSNGYFPPIRDHFVARGIAVYAFDKPGCGASGGDWRRRSLDDRAQEALDARAAVMAQPEVDARAIGLWGQSQGGWVAPLAASMAPEIPFVIPQSCAAISPAEQDDYNVEHSMRRDGHARDDIARGLAFVRAINAAARQQLPWERVEPEIMAPARGQPWHAYYDVNDANDWEFALIWGRNPYDPVATMARVTSPLLGIYGELDVLVPAAQSAATFKRVLAAAGHPDFTITVFPGVNHRIQDEQIGAFPDGYLELMSDWLRERIRRIFGYDEPRRAMRG